MSSDACGGGAEQVIMAMPLAIQNQFKRCSCRKAKCLKLYCVCFAAGVYCSGCACQECVNLPEHQDIVMVERQRVLQRSPRAFMPKVEPLAGNGGTSLHKKGCRCRKSRCLKKYCECFDAGAKCSSMCRCDDCQNRPDSAGPPVALPQLHIEAAQASQALVNGTSGVLRSRRQTSLADTSAGSVQRLQGSQPPIFMHSSGRPPLPPSHGNAPQPSLLPITQALSMHALAAAAAAAAEGDDPCPSGDAANYVLLPSEAVAAVAPAVSNPAAQMRLQLQVQECVSSAETAQSAADVDDLRSLLLENPEAVKQLTGQLGLDDAAQQAAVNAARFLKDILSLSRQDPQALQRSLLAATQGRTAAALAADAAASMCQQQQQQLLPLAPPLSTGPMPPVEVAQQLHMGAAYETALSGPLRPTQHGVQAGEDGIQVVYCVSSGQQLHCRQQQQQQQQQQLQQQQQQDMQVQHEQQQWQAEEQGQQGGMEEVACQERAATSDGEAVDVQVDYRLIDSSRCAPRTMKLTHGNFRIQAAGSVTLGAPSQQQQQLQSCQQRGLQQRMRLDQQQQQQQQQDWQLAQAAAGEACDGASAAVSRTSSLQLLPLAPGPQAPGPSVSVAMAELPQMLLQRQRQQQEPAHVVAYAVQVHPPIVKVEDEQLPQQGRQQQRQPQQLPMQALQAHGWAGAASSKALQLQTGLTGCILYDPVAGTHISLGDGAHIPVTMAVPLEAAALHAQLQQLQPGGRLRQQQQQQQQQQLQPGDTLLQPSDVLLQPGSGLLLPGSRDATKALSPDTGKAARAVLGHGGEEGRAGDGQRDHGGESLPKRRRCSDAPAPSTAAAVAVGSIGGTALHSNGLALDDACRWMMRSVVNRALPISNSSPSRASDSPSDHSCRFRDGMPVMTSPGARPVSPSRPATRSRAKGVLGHGEQGKENTQSQSPSVESFGEADAMRALCDLKHSHA